MADTLALWEELKQGKYAIAISDVTVAEMSQCKEPKRSLMFKRLSEIEFVPADETEETLQLTDSYLNYGVLNRRSRDDCRHIAIATVSGCDYIASWNFKHFVNIRTITKVQAVNKLLGYNEINIVPPSMMLGGDMNED